MSSIKELSLRANVSMPTVSRALNRTAPGVDATRKRVLNAVDQLGYSPTASIPFAAACRSHGRARWSIYLSRDNLVRHLFEIGDGLEQVTVPGDACAGQVGGGPS